jgi:hypothetical protein
MATKYMFGWGKTDEGNSQLQHLWLKSEEEIMEFATHSFSPFLLTSVMSNGDENHFVVTGCEKASIDIDKNNEVTQTFTWIGHKASEEEVKKFSKEEEEE